MYLKLEIWLRVIRFKFLAASAIAVTNGLALSYWYQPNHFNIFYALLTYLGIFCLHASVDLFNDYWDFKRGIDLITKKTKFSGGTGVLPEGLLKPDEVFRAGILFLILGLSIGISFVFVKGYVIALILGFATLSILLYSGKLVNVGLGELFVGTKGAMIVIGSFYVQTSLIMLEPIIVGVITGLLSSLVLYINSIPDIIADKEKGRKTLAIILDNHSPSKIFTFVLGLFIMIYFLTFVFYYFVIDYIYSFIICLFLMPLTMFILYKFYIFLFYYKIIDSFYEKVMEKTILFSRLYGFSIVMGILIIFIKNYKK
ncbi:MAG: prenyltransferase [Thermoproteota archaeon]|nr:prenyltransferase [Thermoproteota archaeon]